jgi:carbamoyl-phosphate synthase large subunit
MAVSNESPVLLDRFLEDAIEVDVDAICDGEQVFIGGIMEHIEQAGVHSGDSACSLPPASLSVEVQEVLRDQTVQLARGLNVVGLMNVQFAIQDGEVYVLEVNPRASRTAPFVSKATGISLAQVAARCMAGISLVEQGIVDEVVPEYFSVKEAVLPFSKFPSVDLLLGPEMKSTGEVMGIGRSFGEAFAKAQRAAGSSLPEGGTALISVRDRDKSAAVEVARDLAAAGFSIVATRGTAEALTAAGIECVSARKVKEGRPHVVDMLKNGDFSLVINTTEGEEAIADSYAMRRAALDRRVTYTTTIAGARATVTGIAALDARDVNRLQDLHQETVHA